MSKTMHPKHILSELYQTGLNSVNGEIAVERALLRNPVEGNVAIIAIGKAAAAMASGAKKQLNNRIQSALIITKEGHADKTLPWYCIESGHPIPNEESLKAGANLLDFIKNIPGDTQVLALISGGASALVEVLPDDMDLALLQKINNWLLGSGLAIDKINQIRQSISLVKGGKTLDYMKQTSMTQYLISDVEGDKPEIIGSGLFVRQKENTSFLKSKIIPEWLSTFIRTAQPSSNVMVHSFIVASNEMACQAIIEKAKEFTDDVIYHGQSLYGDVYNVSKELSKILINTKEGIHVWGGETTVTLPAHPGRGGRNQSLALALACELENTHGITVLIGATDGSDGPTSDAGAIIDGNTLNRAKNEGCYNAKEFLAAADAGTFLEAAGALVSTGPTGTNVMDIVIAIKRPI